MDKQELLKELKDFNNYTGGCNLRGVNVKKELKDYILTATDGYRLKRLRVSEKLLGEIGEEGEVADVS